MGDPTKGLFRKFKVERTDGRHKEGEKHFNCKYFVLDIKHDEHARAAIKAYADSCELEYSKLAWDLRHWLDDGTWNLET